MPVSASKNIVFVLGSNLPATCLLELSAVKLFTILILVVPDTLAKALAILATRIFAEELPKATNASCNLPCFNKLRMTGCTGTSSGFTADVSKFLLNLYVAFLYFSSTGLKDAGIKSSMFFPFKGWFTFSGNGPRTSLPSLKNTKRSLPNFVSGIDTWPTLYITALGAVASLSSLRAISFLNANESPFLLTPKSTKFSKDVVSKYILACSCTRL